MSKVKVYKPTTPARRKTSVVNYSAVLTTDKPNKKLIKRKKTTAGRSRGKITIRHRGGGARKLVREVDFKRNFPEGFKIVSIEYDPTRTAFVALVVDIKTGNKKYIIHTKGMKVGDIFGIDEEIKNCNHVTLNTVPVGTEISQIELQPGKGAQIARSAGTYVVVTAKEDKFVSLKMPSGEIRKVLGTCLCVIGRVGNDGHGLVRVGKAGRKRHMGIRPTVRGKVMNPVDHPHGGGEARNPIGLKYPKTPWGKHALGVKTRKKTKPSTKFIVKRRKKK